MKKKTALRLAVLLGRWVQSYFEHVKNLMQLASLETQLALKSVLRILMLSVVFAMLVVTTWIGLLAALFVFLLSLHLSWLLTFLIVGLLNISMLVGVGLLILRVKKDMSFTATRRQWHKVEKRTTKKRRGRHE